MSADETLQVARLFCRHLADLRVPYFVTGSLASSLHGIPRTTHDADVIALLDGRHVQPLLRSLEADFILAEERLRSAVRNRRSCNALHRSTSTKVDLYIAESSRRTIEAFARLCWVEIDNTPIPFSSAEESILSKLVWYREGGQQSDQQWRDILGILQVSGTRLDVPFLERWVADLDLEDLWKRALKATRLGR